MIIIIVIIIILLLLLFRLFEKKITILTGPSLHYLIACVTLTNYILSQ